MGERIALSKLVEAKEWLTGSRSNWNLCAHLPDGLAVASKSDAGEAERAYWMLRAVAEGLIEVANDGRER